jgi:hypothetical protein
MDTKTGYVLKSTDGREHDVTLGELRGWLADGSVTPAHQVYSSTTGSWLRADEVIEIQPSSSMVSTPGKNLSEIQLQQVITEIQTMREELRKASRLTVGDGVSLGIGLVVVLPVILACIGVFFMVLGVSIFGHH